jgi:hypothetical protein
MILAIDKAAAQEDEELGVYSLSLGGAQAGVEWVISIQLPPLIAWVSEVAS